MRRLAALAIAATLTIAAAIAAAGCGGSDQTAQVRATLARFVRATSRQDYKTLCEQILAPSLVQNVEQIGLPCEIALSRGFGQVSQPTLVVRSVSISGDRARATVHTTAANQAPLDGTVNLTRIGGRWRVASLAAPAG
jgi:hypothetical protein